MNAEFDLSYEAGEGFVTVKYAIEIEKSADKMNFLTQVAILLGAMTKEQALVVVNPCSSFPEDGGEDYTSSI